METLKINPVRNRERMQPVGAGAISRLVFWLVLASTAVAVEAEVVYVIARDELYFFDVDSGVARSIGPTEVDRVFFGDTALGPDGLLYGTGLSVDTYDLYVIDPQTGRATAIGPLVDAASFAHPSALAFDTSGRLWMTSGPMLYQVEPTSAALTPMANLEREVQALAALGDELYALTLESDRQSLEAIDLDTLELQPRFDLPDVEGFILDATFDSGGRLRIVAQGGGILAVVVLLFYQVADLSTGEVEETFSMAYHFTEPLAGIRNMAGRGPQASMEIPVLDGAAGAVFGLLLLAAALIRLRQPL